MPEIDFSLLGQPADIAGHFQQGFNTAKAARDQRYQGSILSALAKDPHDTAAMNALFASNPSLAVSYSKMADDRQDRADALESRSALSDWVSGLANASVEGLQRAKKAFVTGDAADDVMKVDSHVQEAIGGTLGKIVRLPTRALTAADEFWKSINASAELHALAYRKAMNEGVDAADRKARYESLIKAPTGDMAKAAEDAARYYTFQKELGAAGRAVQNLSNKVPGLKLVIPFVRTPANIVKFAGERSVFGIAMPEVRKALAAGGRSRDEALAKITLGSGLSTAAVLAAMNGRLSGSGPSDPRERAALTQAGWQPYSVKVGDRWVSYQRFDPLSMLAGVAADFVDAGTNVKRADAGKLATHLTLGIAKNLTNKTWLSGAADFFQMLDDPDRYGDRYFRNLAATAVVPSIANQAAQAIDPNLRDARTLMDAIKARTPVASKSVMPRRDMWGEAMTRGDSVGPDVISPLYATTVTHDPLRAEIARLRVPITMPQRKVMVAGERVELTPEQYDQYQAETGKAAQRFLKGAIAMPSWQAMTDDQRTDFIKDAFTDARKSAREKLNDDYPELAGSKQGRGMPALPPGYAIEGAAPAVPMRQPPRQAHFPSASAPISTMPPLPPGYQLSR